MLLPLLLLGIPLLDECRSDRLEPAAVTVAEVFSGELASAMEAQWRPSWGRTYATVSPDDSLAAAAMVYSQGATAPEREAARETLVAHLVQVPPTGERWHLVISEESGVQLRMVRGFESCAPRITNRLQITDAIRDVGRRVGIRDARTLVVMVYVNVDGGVDDLRVDQSTGDFRLDQELAEIARRVRFRPAMVEGLPVPVWTRFPISVAPERR